MPSARTCGFHLKVEDRGQLIFRLKAEATGSNEALIFRLKADATGSNEALNFRLKAEATRGNLTPNRAYSDLSAVNGSTRIARRAGR
jgi:hypothetical protein